MILRCRSRPAGVRQRPSPGRRREWIFCGSWLFPYATWCGWRLELAQRDVEAHGVLGEIGAAGGEAVDVREAGLEEFNEVSASGQRRQVECFCVLGAGCTECDPFPGADHEEIGIRELRRLALRRRGRVRRGHVDAVITGRGDLEAQIAERTESVA